MNLFKIYILANMMLVFGFTVNAQQTALFPEYNYNPFIINSAYAGMGYGAEATLSHYGFLNGIEGSPTTSTLSYHTPAYDRKMGLGGAVLHDKIGVTTSTHVFAAYSYKIFFESNRPYWQVYDQNVLSFGITGGVQLYSENLLDLGIVGDPAFDRNIHATIPTVGVGFLYNRKDFYAGVSAPNVLNDQLVSQDDLKLRNPFYGYFGYRFFTNMYEEIMLKPSVLLKHERGAPMQVDLNLAINYKNEVEIGMGYRSSSSINILCGIYAFEKLKFVYFYNAALKNSPLSNSHGIVFSYCFDGNY